MAATNQKHGDWNLPAHHRHSSRHGPARGIAEMVEGRLREPVGGSSTFALTATSKGTHMEGNRLRKANFDAVYDLDDPREYLGTLGKLNYEIPEHGRLIFSALIEARLRVNGTTSKEHVSVLDLCCSYGINAALLKHEVTLDDLYKRYGSADVLGLSSEELVASDTAFFGERRKEPCPSVAGLDAAGNAVSYGLKAGLLDAGFAENLEENEPTVSLKEAVASADLLTVTGGVGYITDRTFERLLGAGGAKRSPWVAALVLRTVPYGGISEVLSECGLITEKLSGHSFKQRRFATPEEREFVLRELSKMGLDPAGKEDGGAYHTDFYLSRPAEEAEGSSVEELLASHLGSLGRDPLRGRPTDTSP